ncbi:hypothetical protein M6B38_364680 [Iris pallida]|uniref:Ribosomal protein L4 n=1 Tax=Iris pallida TaxID=29817 RepID=A0AAX6GHK9_IRIPA|nr:hypothetical protein M6B38_185085 [Iris pallida]KAJ6828032.1 hypothetical protein M6B38_364680 [Iris pallida]
MQVLEIVDVETVLRPQPCPWSPQKYRLPTNIGFWETRLVPYESWRAHQRKSRGRGGRRFRGGATAEHGWAVARPQKNLLKYFLMFYSLVWINKFLKDRYFKLHNTSILVPHKLSLKFSPPKF